MMHKVTKKTDTTHALLHFAIILRSHCKGNTLSLEVLPEAIHPRTYPYVKICKLPTRPYVTAD